MLTYSIETRWALSSSTSFGEDEQNFRLDDFYYDILELLDEEAPMRNEKFDRAWADATLAWWKKCVSSFMSSRYSSLSTEIRPDFNGPLEKRKQSTASQSQPMQVISQSAPTGGYQTLTAISHDANHYSQLKNECPCSRLRNNLHPPHRLKNERPPHHLKNGRPRRCLKNGTPRRRLKNGTPNQ